MADELRKTELSRDIARLMLVMRRLIREEFSVTIHLDEADAPAELLAFAERSENPVLHEMAVELGSCTNAFPDKEADSDTVSEPVTYYRGAPVQESRPATESAASDQSSPPTGKRIYRGRVIG